MLAIVFHPHFLHKNVSTFTTKQTLLSHHHEPVNVHPNSPQKGHTNHNNEWLRPADVTRRIPVQNKLVRDYVTTSQNLNTPQQRLITLTSFGFSTNSEWAVKSANLHREYFSSTISLSGLLSVPTGGWF